MELVNLLKDYVTLQNLYHLFCLFMVTDIVSGMVKAWKQGRFKSRTMRDGLFASLGEVILLALCITVGKIIPVSETVIFALFIFMNLKEFASILENLKEIGVNVPEWLCKGLNVYTEKANKGE